MSKATFEAIDLIIFTIISAVLEAGILLAYKAFGYMEGYIVSFAVTLGLISIFRWNWHGIVVPLVTGIVSVFIGGIYDLGLVLSNTLGYLFLLPVLFWFKKKDKKTISKDIGFLLGYFFSGYISVEIGRTLCQLIDVRDIAKLGTILYSYFVIDLLNIGIGLLVFFIACKQKNLVVDMNSYLIELHTKPASADAREEKKDYLSLESMCDDISEVNDIALLDGGTLSENDLKLLNDTYSKHTNTKSKYYKEQEAISQYQKSRGSKKDNKKS